DTFSVKPVQPRAAVNLGVGVAWPHAATLDGSPAYLQPGPESGFVLRVDPPGALQAGVDLQIPLPPRKGAKGDRSFALELPRAAITTLERLDLPLAVTEARIGSRTVRTTPVEPRRSRLEGT